MAQAVDQHLDRTAAIEEIDRRNGDYHRHLLTKLGDIELLVQRTWRFAPRMRWCGPMPGGPSRLIA
jgi:hypothetical protein